MSARRWVAVAVTVLLVALGAGVVLTGGPAEKSPAAVKPAAVSPAGASAAPSPATQSPATQSPVAGPGNITATVWTWNVSGWVFHRASATTGLVPVVTASIREQNADLVALNELCWDQYEAIRADLAASRWAVAENFSLFEPQHDNICNGKPFGLAIFSKTAFGTADSHALAVDPADQGERRKLLCAPVGGRRLKFCTTHISPYGVLKTQLTEAQRLVDGFGNAGDTVVIAGDFNSEPHHDRLDSWYSGTLSTPLNSGNRGRFRELDDTEPTCPGYGEGTVGPDAGTCRKGPKIDLIFASADKIVGPYRADSLPVSAACGGPCSDHRIVYGTVTVAVSG